MAFGAPGIAPRWTSSAKEGLGTAYSGSCRLWFTLSHGIINEIYYPTVDQPNTRDFEFLISDGQAFCHEEKRDLDHRIDYPERNCLLYRLTNSERNGRYQIIKQVLADPEGSVLLMHTKLEVRDESLRGRLNLYALLAPHIAQYGAGNSGWCCEIGANKLLRAERGGFHLVIGCNTGFSRRSVGYVGSSDGWQDLMNNFKMDWEFCAAEDGNIALTGEIDLQRGNEFTIAIALGHSYQSAAANLLQSLAIPFDLHRESYIRVHRSGASFFDPWVMISRAATYLILQGPVTGQERWEENAGYSPSTLATVIASLVCAAAFAKERGEMRTSDFLLEYADWLVAHLEEWLVTTRGELVDGFPRHYIRLNPTDAQAPEAHPDPNSAMISIANGGGNIRRGIWSAETSFNWRG